MNDSNRPFSACRYCRYYQVEGRRGGNCEQLGVLVQGDWAPCILASSIFTPTWDNLQDIVLLENTLYQSSTEVEQNTKKVKA